MVFAQVEKQALGLMLLSAIGTVVSVLISQRKSNTSLPPRSRLEWRLVSSAPCSFSFCSRSKPVGDSTGFAESRPIDVAFPVGFRHRMETDICALLWLTEAQMTRLQPFLPKSHGDLRADDPLPRQRTGVTMSKGSHIRGKTNGKSPASLDRGALASRSNTTSAARNVPTGSRSRPED